MTSMKRWPFGAAAALLICINMLRLGSDIKLRIWNDPVCAIFFVGYVICIAIALAIRTTTSSAPPAG